MGRCATRRGGRWRDLPRLPDLGDCHRPGGPVFSSKLSGLARLLSGGLLFAGGLPRAPSQQALSYFAVALGILLAVGLLLRFRRWAGPRHLATYGIVAAACLGLSSLVAGRLFPSRTNSGPPFLQNVVAGFGDYATSYLMILLGGCLTVVLLLRARHLPAARYLAAWSVVSYGFIGVGLVLGRISDQFFYYLIVPAIAVSGYGLALLFESPVVRLVEAEPRTSQALARPGLPIWSGRIQLRRSLPLLTVLVVWLYNGHTWVENYGRGFDNSYARIFYYIRQNIPNGEIISLGNDVGNYLFSPYYRVSFFIHQIRF